MDGKAAVTESRAADPIDMSSAFAEAVEGQLNYDTKMVSGSLATLAVKHCR
jgi:thiazole synthase ThiGH ThiG subunit